MRSHRSQHGFTLVQIIVGAMLLLIVATGLLSMVRVIYTSQETVTSQNGADSTVRHALDEMIDNLRSAQNNPSDNNSVLSAANASDITLYQSYYDYTQSPPALVYYTIRYWLDTSVSPKILKRTIVKNGVTTTTPIGLGITSLTLTYYVANGSYTATSASWQPTGNPNSPGGGERPQVGAIQVTATATTWDNYTRTLTSLVRLMNSPYQVIP